MKFRTSFRSKLLLLTIMPLAVAQAVTLFAVMRTVENDIDRRARESLTIGGTVVSEFLLSRGEQLRTSVEVLAADFGLKQAAATGDADTIVSVLVNHSQRVDADIGILLDVDGGLVASTVDRLSQDWPSVAELVRISDGPISNQVAATIDGVTYQLFAVPLRAPVTVGWVVLGFRIDARVMNRIAGLTGLKVTILSKEGVHRQTLASTLSKEVAADPASNFFPPGSPLDSVYTVSDEGQDWFALGKRFIQGQSNVIVLLQRSKLEAMAPYNDARRGLLVFAAFLLLITGAGAAWFSVTVSRPLRTLTDAARRMISGNYDTRVSVASDDEIGELASSFNAMRKAISDREQRISHQALHDPLTNLPNRTQVVQGLTRTIEHARSADAKVTILSVGLSRMAAISSTLGHSASDQVIALAAKHLKVNLNPGEVLGHVGTNEFVLILPDTDIDDAVTYADRIENILGAGVSLGRVNITLQTAIGIAEFPQHGEHAADLLRRASIARSEAESRRERLAIYKSGSEDHHVRQLRIVNDLRKALQDEQVHIHYQPKVSLPDGNPIGAEALVRWQHPEFGLLSPDDFIPAAEQAGTIIHLTRYVLAGAIRDCAEWQKGGFELHISINLSARDLQNEYLPHYVLQVLEEHHIEPGRLTLEITEGTVMQEIHLARTVMHCLKDIGVRISMDDFGTGHSSLAQLKNIPLHELKIDKSFVTNLLDDEQNEAIVRATVELAHNLKLEVVAEGVEDQATLQHLAGEGCEQAQGYFISKPVTSDALLAWLQNYDPASLIERRSETRVFAKKA